MTACVLCLLLLSGSPEPEPLALQAGNAPRVDHWLAEDKIRHFGMSFAVTAFTYASARTVLDPDPALAVAGSAAIIAGIGKEIHDVRAGQFFSLKDLVWDLAGVAVGLVLVHSTR
jgi:uncharacterized protein YfiM (DUF2279 family)